MRWRKKILLWVSLIFFLLFIIIGYILSDAIYYRCIIQQNTLQTPELAYEWVLKNNLPISESKNRYYLNSYATPRFLFENRKPLFCDEGSIGIATLANSMGFKTRLVDLLGMDSVSHHTILEVEENGRWIKYDYLKRLYNVSYDSSAGYPLLKYIYRQYPKPYNYVINHNYFIKKVSLWFRGIQEDSVRLKR